MIQILSRPWLQSRTSIGAIALLLCAAMGWYAYQGGLPFDNADPNRAIELLLSGSSGMLLGAFVGIYAAITVCFQRSARSAVARAFGLITAATVALHVACLLYYGFGV